ncbi:hypothetical protein LINPERPRIM_LOCUS13169 [Linum perenne]
MIITPSSHLLLLSTTIVVTIPFSPSSTGTTTTNLHEILSHLASTSIAITLRLNSSHPISNHSSSSIYTASLVQTPYLTVATTGTQSPSLRYFASIHQVRHGHRKIPLLPLQLPQRSPFRNPTFLPKKSSSDVLLPCDDPKCHIIFGYDVIS